jgi:hypothetical protein
MNFKVLVSIKAVICLLFGLGFVFIPLTVASYYGMDMGAGGQLMAQFFGAAFLLIGLLLLSARGVSEYSAQKPFMAAIFVGDMAGFVVSLLAVLDGIMNSLGWVSVGLYLVFALAFGFLWISKPKSA